jgi:adenine C2-methylase RlmN of 23S rRNA A2503 and tRNA A37
LFSLSVIRQFAPFLSSLGPAWFRRKIVEWTPHHLIQKVKDMSDVMHQTAQEILSRKRKELLKEMDTEENGKDIISVLCEFALCFTDSDARDTNSPA